MMLSASSAVNSAEGLYRVTWKLCLRFHFLSVAGFHKTHPDSLLPPGSWFLLRCFYMQDSCFSEPISSSLFLATDARIGTAYREDFCQGAAFSPRSDLLWIMQNLLHRGTGLLWSRLGARFSSSSLPSSQPALGPATWPGYFNISSSVELTTFSKGSSSVNIISRTGWQTGDNLHCQRTMFTSVISLSHFSYVSSNDKHQDWRVSVRILS